MAKNDRLFLLIKSLTKTEKRYFKLFATLGGESKNYLRLFDAIDKMAGYDEQKIKRRFRSEAFVSQLHVTKNHLHKLILKSLRNFHANHSTDAELKEALRDIEILYKKELFSHCRVVIGKAKRMATEYEKHNDLIELLGWEKKLLLATSGPGRDSEAFNTLLQCEKEQIAKLQNVHDYWDLTLNFSEIMQAQQMGKDGALAKPALLQDENCAHSLAAKILYFYNLQMYAFYTKNNAAVESICDQLITLIESQPHRISENPVSYITALNNKIGLFLQLKKIEAIPPLLARIRDIPQKYGLKPQSPIAMKAVLQTYNVELEMYRDTGDADAGLARVAEIEKLLNHSSSAVPADYVILLSYQIAYLYFMKKAYRRALHWLNGLRNQNFGEIREDIQSYAQLLNLIIHFELGNTTVLKYAVESCRRFLKRKRELQSFEKVLLRFFSRLSLAPRDAHHQLFERLKSELFAESDDKTRKRALDYLDFEKWINSKLEGEHSRAMPRR